MDVDVERDQKIWIGKIGMSFCNFQVVQVQPVQVQPVQVVPVHVNSACSEQERTQKV